MFKILKWQNKAQNTTITSNDLSHTIQMIIFHLYCQILPKIMPTHNFLNLLLNCSV